MSSDIAGECQKAMHASKFALQTSLIMFCLLCDLWFAVQNTALTHTGGQKASVLAEGCT